MPGIASHLKTIDLFAHKHETRYRNSTKENTAVGGIITIFAVIFSIFTLFFFGRELYEKNNPIVSAGEKQISEARVPLKKQEFLIIVVDGFGNLIHLLPEFSKTFEISAFKNDLSHVKNGEEGKLTPIDVVPCSDEFISDELLEAQAVKLPKSVGLCLNVTEEDEVVDEYASPTSETYIFRIKLCDEAKNPGCRAMFTSINNMQVVLYSKEQFFNPEDFENPIGFRVSTTPTDLSPGLKIIRNHSIQISEASVDNAIIFDFPESTTFYSTFDSKIQTKLFSETSRDIFDVRFEAVKLKKTFRRRYLKIQELIAFVGGFIKGIVSLGAAIGKLYANYSFIQRIMLIEAVKSSERLPERQSSIVIRKPNQSTDHIMPDSKNAKEKKFSFWNFLIGNLSSTYLKKRGIDYSPVLSKFDVYATYEAMKGLRERIIRLEAANNPI